VNSQWTYAMEMLYTIYDEAMIREAVYGLECREYQLKSK